MEAPRAAELESAAESGLGLEKCCEMPFLERMFHRALHLGQVLMCIWLTEGLMAAQTI